MTLFAFTEVILVFILLMINESFLWNANNKCGAANHNTLKFLTPSVEMDLQQPHIYFNAQIYTSTYRYGILNCCSCFNGVRIGVARLLLIPIYISKYKQTYATKQICLVAFY